jgi:hypothetical protein
MQFTRATVAAMSLPEGKIDFVYWDDDLPCFGLRLRGDTRRWIVQYRFGGQSRRESLGDPRKVSLEDARKAAKARFGKLANGIDPGAEKAKAKAEAAEAKLTLAYISDRYLEARSPSMRPATLSAAKRDLKMHMAPLASRPIAAIKRADVAARLGEIARDNGRSAAARARSNLAAMYGWAMREGLAEANPVILTNNPNEGAKPRERVLSDDELRIIWRVRLRADRPSAHAQRMPTRGDMRPTLGRDQSRHRRADHSRNQDQESQ